MVVGVIINMAAGALWYSPILFANPWMAANNITKEEIAARGSEAVKGYVVAFVASVLVALVLAVLVQTTKADDVVDGLVLGLMTGIGFVATAMGANYIFESRPMNLYLINAGYPVVVHPVLGVLLATWQ